MQVPFPRERADDGMDVEPEAVAVCQMKESKKFTAERQMEPWEEDIYNSWKLRSQLPQHRFSDAALD